MKNNQWDVIEIDNFLGPSVIGIITEVLQDIEAYYVIVCGSPERGHDMLIYEHEIVDNITKNIQSNNNQITSINKQYK
jgi:hypothetical protein